jgi:hypothetical protein
MVGQWRSPPPLTGEGLLAEQEGQGLQHLLLIAQLVNGALVGLLGQDHQVVDGVEVVLVPAGGRCPPGSRVRRRGRRGALAPSIQSAPLRA